MTALTSDEPDWKQQLSGLVLVAENVLESWNSHQKVCVFHKLQNLCKWGCFSPILLLIAWTRNAAAEVIAAATAAAAAAAIPDQKKHKHKHKQGH